MKRFVVAASLCIFLLCLSYQANADTFTCLACHSAMKGKVKTGKGVLLEVNVDGDRYAQSVHGGNDCLSCHKQFSSNPHEPQGSAKISKDAAALSSKLSGKAQVDPVALAACADCHSEIYKMWQDSVHGKNIIDKKQTDGASCLDCHGSPHYITPKNTADAKVNRNNVVKTCGECHDNEPLVKKYNLGTDILKRYYESFHGKKYLLGHPNAPACINCHGYHDVKKWDDPKSPVAWENRTTTCGQCHKGATKKFVAAITHKPIGKDDPIPYWFEKGLIVLLLSVFIFITGHVILEAISEIRDRIFRKGGHNE